MKESDPLVKSPKVFPADFVDFSHQFAVTIIAVAVADPVPAVVEPDFGDAVVVRARCLPHPVILLVVDFLEFFAVVVVLLAVHAAYVGLVFLSAGTCWYSRLRFLYTSTSYSIVEKSLTKEITITRSIGTIVIDIRCRYYFGRLGRGFGNGDLQHQHCWQNAGYFCQQCYATFASKKSVWNGP